MVYLKSLIRKVTQDSDVIKKINKCSSDKDCMEFLLSNGFNKEELIKATENHFGFHYIALDNTKIDQNIINTFDKKGLQSQLIIPYQFDDNNKCYYFAMYEIMNDPLRESIKKECSKRGYDAKFDFAFDYEIIEAYKSLDNDAQDTNFVSDSDFNATEWVDEVLRKAIKYGASDIHIENLEKGMQVRYRIDGVLSDKKFYNFDKSQASNIAVRIKIISEMDISEKRKAQDGRIDNYSANGKKYDMRVSSVNTIWGEKFVLRLFDKNSGTRTFQQVGFSERDTNTMLEMLKNKNGIIYMAGATGSGKTNTLYTMIETLNHDDINIYTIEDPVEKTIKNVNHIQIDPMAGANYVNTLSALLRQDPDVIIVGEIRDNETADLSLRASLTGHLVLSTVHANGAIDAISRLLDMNVEPYLLSASAIGFLSQRLVRKLCPHCKEKIMQFKPYEQAWLDMMKEKYNVAVDMSNFYRGVGCSECNGGYKGRVAVVEILEATDKMKSLIAKNASSDDLRKQALADGFRPMIVNGLEKAINGETSIDEIIKRL